jgi:hypothetical protein
MAAVKTVLKKTTNKVIVRITATAAADTATIDLQTDCKMTNETLVAGADSQLVNIAEVFWTTDSSVKLERNGVLVGDFHGGGQIVEAEWVITDQQSKDIVVTFAGAGTIMLVLSKVAGFNTPIEDAQFGGGDNPTAVGS